MKAKQYSLKISKIWLIRSDIWCCTIKIDFLIFEFGNLLFLVILFMPRPAFFGFDLKNEFCVIINLFFYKEVNPGNCIAACCNYLQKFE